MEGKYKFHVGTARGTLLATVSTPNEKLKHVKPEEASEVTALINGRTTEEIFVGFKSGKVSVFDAIEHKFGKSIRKLEGSGAVCGLGVVSEKCVVVGRHDGIVNVWNGKKSDFFSLDLEEKSTLEALELNANRNGVVGTGGEENDFKLWDLETRKCIFSAKSLGHDELNLRIPTSIRGICFFLQEPSLSCCATKQGQVLLYDDRAQRKPIVKYVVPNVSFTTISCAFRQRQCLVGTTRGYMQLVEMGIGKCLRTYQGFTGSVTNIACDAMEPFVASTSLDRHLRIHNLETKELVFKVYMKQNLTRLLMEPIVKEEISTEKVLEGVVDEEYEELFNKMETTTEDSSKKKIKKRKTVVEIVEKKKTKKKEV